MIGAIRTRPYANSARRSTSALSLVRLVPLALIAGFTLYALGPFWWLIVAATKTNGGIVGTFGLWFPAHPDPWSNLANLSKWDGGVFWHWAGNSILYTVVGTGVATMFSSMAGYAVALYRFWGRRLLIALLIVTAAIPGAILAFPIYLFLAKLGLTNTITGMFLTLLVNPFGVFFVWLYLHGVDVAPLTQAARIDGAGEFRIFGSIVLPILSPGLVTVALLDFVGIWNNYFLPSLLLSNNKLQPLTVGLTILNSEGSLGAGAGHQVVYGMVVVGVLISIIPIIVLFLLLQRYWRNGLLVGSVTG